MRNTQFSPNDVAYDGYKTQSDEADGESNDQQRDDESDLDSDEDEEKLFLRVLAEEKVSQIQQTRKVDTAANELIERTQRNEKVPLGNIRGDWSLFSLEYLETYASEPGLDVDEINGWTPGRLRISDDYLDQTFHGPNSDMVIDFYAIGSSDPIGGAFETPQFASLNPVTVVLCSCDNDVYEIEVTFLGNGFLEMCFSDPYKALSGLYDVVLYGILDVDYS